MADLDDDIPTVEGLDDSPEALPPAPGAAQISADDIPEVIVDDASASENHPSGTGNSALDALIGLGEGATLKHGAELGEAGSWIGTKLADLLQPSRARDGMEPEYAGRRGADPQEFVDRAGSTVAGKIGQGLGMAATGVAASAAAPVTVTGQAAVGAGTGGLAAAGDSGYDPLSILTGASAGGLAGGTLGALAKGATGASSAMKQPVYPSPSTVTTRGEQALAELAKSKPSLAQSFMEPMSAAKNALGRGAITTAMQAERAAPALRGTGQVLAPASGALIGSPSTASAQEPAYGTPTTMSWAVQSVLSGGDTGLPPEDEQRLTEAVVSGDVDKVISANFALQMRHPKFAKRMRDELESLQEE